MVFLLNSSSSEVALADYFKIVLLGSSGVGKTSIIRWILDLDPLDEYLPTIGVRIHNVDTIFNEKQFFLQFCDVSGHEIYSDLISSFLKAANVVVLVFDYKNTDSQLRIKSLYSSVCENISPTQVLLIGNKVEDEKKDIPKALESWVKQHNLTLYPVSIRKNLGKSIILQNITQIIAKISSE